MALGSKHNNPNLVVFSLKLKTKDEPKPVFIVSQKQEDGKFHEVNRVHSVSGTLIEIEHRETPYNGDVIKSVSLYLKDGDEFYMVSLPYTILSRSVFNSLLNLKSFEDIEISLYNSKPREDGKVYGAASVWQNRQLVNWAFERDALPATPEITFKGKKMRDTEALDKFFEEKIRELNTRIKAKTVVVPNKAVATPEPAIAAPEGDTDVPF